MTVPLLPRLPVGPFPYPPLRLMVPALEVPAPCGQHVVFYPARLAQWAINSDRHLVFHTTCECPLAYLVTTEIDGTWFRAAGRMLTIVAAYEDIPWPEVQIQDENGVFFCKEAESYDELLEYFRSSGDAQPDRPSLS